MNKRDQTIGAVVSYFVIVLFLLYIVLSAVGTNNETTLLVVLLTVLIATFIFCFFILKGLRRDHKIAEIDFLNIGTQRYLLGIFMVFYGLPKIFGTFFDYQLFALDSKLIDVSEFELAWYYFGKNKWQELFAGFMELAPALLLFNRRTYFLGAIILLPVTSQVFILNLFFKIGGITFPAATILLLCNLYIIYSQKDKIILFIKSLNFNSNVDFGRGVKLFIEVAKWTTVLIVVCLIFINMRPIFYKSAQRLAYEKLIGAYTLESIVKNNNSYLPTNDSLLYKDIYIEKQSRWNILRRYNNETSAFVMITNNKNDSIAIYLSSNGIGDEKDIIDSATVLKGTYKMNNDLLIINGIQLSDTLELTYKRKGNIQPKKWFW